MGEAGALRSQRGAGGNIVQGQTDVDQQSHVQGHAGGRDVSRASDRMKSSEFSAAAATLAKVKLTYDSLTSGQVDITPDLVRPYDMMKMTDVVEDIRIMLTEDKLKRMSSAERQTILADLKVAITSLKRLGLKHDSLLAAQHTIDTIQILTHETAETRLQSILKNPSVQNLEQFDLDLTEESLAKMTKEQKEGLLDLLKQLNSHSSLTRTLDEDIINIRKGIDKLEIKISRSNKSDEPKTTTPPPKKKMITLPAAPPAPKDEQEVSQQPGTKVPDSHSSTSKDTTQKSLTGLEQVVSVLEKGMKPKIMAATDQFEGVARSKFTQYLPGKALKAFVASREKVGTSKESVAAGKKVIDMLTDLAENFETLSPEEKAQGLKFLKTLQDNAWFKGFLNNDKSSGGHQTASFQAARDKMEKAPLQPSSPSPSTKQPSEQSSTPALPQVDKLQTSSSPHTEKKQPKKMAAESTRNASLFNPLEEIPAKDREAALSPEGQFLILDNKRALPKNQIAATLALTSFAVDGSLSPAETTKLIQTMTALLQGNISEQERGILEKWLKILGQSCYDSAEGLLKDLQSADGHTPVIETQLQQLNDEVTIERLRLMTPEQTKALYEQMLSLSEKLEKLGFLNPFSLAEIAIEAWEDEQQQKR